MPLIIRMLPSLLALLAMPLWGYTLLTGRWIRWPIRARRVPETPGRRRVTAIGMIFVLLSVLITTLNAPDPGASRARFIDGLVAAGVAVVLALAAVPLILAGYHRTSESDKQYQLHG